MIAKGNTHLLFNLWRAATHRAVRRRAEEEAARLARVSH